MTAPAPDRRSGSGARYTPPGQHEEPTSSRPRMIRIVAAVIIVAMVLAPLAFLFAL